MFHEGDIADHFLLSVKRRLSIKKFEASGHIFAHRLVGPNNVLGEIPLYETNTRTYVFNAIARENARYIPSVMMFGTSHCKGSFIGHCNDENLHTSYAATTSQIQRFVVVWQKGAFYSTLLRLANSYGIQREDGIFIDIALTNQELAEFAATSRESLNRMLSELRKLGYVAYDKHHLVICDFDALIGLLDLEVDNIDPNISNIE